MAAPRRATSTETQSHLGGREHGLYLGRFLDEDAKTSGQLGNKLIYSSERHAIIFGPNGSGKGTRFLMPNLLGDYLGDRSVVVIDPKGELAAVTAWHRQHVLGHDVKILDPFGKLFDAIKNSPEHNKLIASLLMKRGFDPRDPALRERDVGALIDDGFNPLDGLEPVVNNKPNPNFYDDAAAIGEALIKLAKGTEAPHWSESAQGLVTAFVMWEKVRRKEPGEIASLENVRKLLTEADTWGPEIGDDGKPTGEQIQTLGLAARARDMVENGGYEIASLAGRFTQKNDELASIQSTADTQTRWLLSPRMRESIGKPSGIDFRQLKEKLTTVYVILPSERMRTHSVWLRLVVVSVLRALYRVGGLRTMLLIDEMAALGHLGPLEDAFGLVRGYRVQIAGVLQDLGQLKDLYKERWESFMANAGVIMGYAPNDLTTGEWMSRRSGQTTVIAQSVNTGESVQGAHGSKSSGEAWNQVGRPYYLPHDLFGMHEGSGVLWLAGLADTVRFFGDKYANLSAYNDRALPNPYWEG
jgi:type IV secretion system protein VirD4